MKTFDTTLMDLSSDISCTHKDILARQERDMFFHQYVNHFTHNQPRIQYQDRIHRVTNNKRDFFEKTEYYNTGNWVNQFETKKIEPLFNDQSKKKVN